MVVFYRAAWTSHMLPHEEEEGASFPPRGAVKESRHGQSAWLPRLGG